MNSKKPDTSSRHSRDLSAEALAKEEAGNPVQIDSSKVSQSSSNIKYQISNISPLIVVVGETASGKTAASIKIAQKVNGEIICADSRTVYKQMDIGTAKPTKKEQELVPHHLINVVEPNETFSAAEFKRLAEKCIQEIVGRGKVPIIVGGTGLYVDSVLYNFQFKDKPNEAYRTQLLQMTDEELTTLLHTKNIDTSNLNTKNRRHMIRAIERGGEVPQNTKPRENTLILGLRLDREILKKRITARVEQMFAEGLIAETAAIVEQYGADIEALRTPGYKAAARYLKREITLEEAKQAFVTADLQLAKRQRTWFKPNPHIQWLNNPEELLQTAIKFMHS